MYDYLLYFVVSITCNTHNSDNIVWSLREWNFYENGAKNNSQRSGCDAYRSMLFEGHSSEKTVPYLNFFSAFQPFSLPAAEWIFNMWFFSLSFRLVLNLHSVHEKLNSWECNLACLVSCDFSTNAREQVSHLKFFSPLWALTWACIKLALGVL